MYFTNTHKVFEYKYKYFFFNFNNCIQYNIHVYYISVQPTCTYIMLLLTTIDLIVLTI